MSRHPFHDFFPCGQFSLFDPGELSKEMEHVLEEEGFCAARALGDREPDQLDGIADRRSAPQIEIFEFTPRVVDVVENSDGRIVTPGEGVKDLAPGGFALIVFDRGRVFFEDFHHPVPNAH